jgi:hypothetical protein
MLFLNCGQLIDVYGFSGRMSYSPKAKFSSNMSEFDFYEINSYLLKLYQNTGIKTADLVEFFKNALINSITVEKVYIHYMDGEFVEDSNCEYEATFSYIKNFPFVIRGGFRDIRKFVHAVLLYCNRYDWDYDTEEYPTKDRNPINSLIVSKYGNNLGKLLDEIMNGLKPLIDNNFSSKNKEEILKAMPWALDPFKNMELSRLIEKPY